MGEKHDSVAKKALQQHRNLYVLRRWKKFGISKTTLVQICKAVCSGVLDYTPLLPSDVSLQQSETEENWSQPPK